MFKEILLTEVLFSKVWAEWRETKQDVQQPQIRSSMAVTTPRPKGARGRNRYGSPEGKGAVQGREV